MCPPSALPGTTTQGAARYFFVVVVVLRTADVCVLDVGLTPPKKTLTSGQIIISYVKLFLNNEKKLHVAGLVRNQSVERANPTHIRSTDQTGGDLVE